MVARNRLPRWYAPSVGVLAVWALAAAALSGDDRATAEPIGGAQAHPPVSVRRLVFTEVWRVGADNAECLVGLPIAALALDGEVYLLDQQLCTVTVFDRHGRKLRSFGRPGEGPGDLRWPRALVDLGPGQVGVLDQRPAAVHRFDRQGRLVVSLGIGSESAEESALEIHGRDSLLVVLSSRMQVVRESDRMGRESRNRWARLTSDGRLDPIYYEWTHRFVYYGRAEPVVEADLPVVRCVAGAGRVYCAPQRDAYRVDVYAVNGDTLGSIVRDYMPRRRSAAERERITAERGQAVDGSLTIDYRAAECDPAILALRLGDDGRLWVLSSRGALDPPAGVDQVWDIFDAGGTLCERVEIVLGADRERDSFFWLADERVVLCRNRAGAAAAYYRPGSAAGDTGVAGDASEAGLEVVLLAARRP